MKTKKIFCTLGLCIYFFASGSAQTREIEVVDFDANGDATIEFITNDLPSEPTHRNMLIGVNQSSEGFIRMLTDHDLSLWTDNIQRMTIDKDGRIGMGELNPTVRLHVRSDGTSNTQTIVQTLESNTSNRPLLLFSEGGSTLGNGMSIEYDGQLAGADNKMHINGLDGVPRLTVLSGGKVGVGETTPLESLDVNGNIGLRDGVGNINFYEASTIKASIDYNGATLKLETQDSGGDIDLAPADDVFLNAGDHILFRSGGITRGVMNNTGDFGMGAATPAAKLDVRHASTATDPILYLRQLNGDYARMRMTSNSTVEFWNIEGRSLGTDPEFNIVYNDGGTLKTALSVDGDNQRVGVNDTAPTAALHVKQVGSGEEGIAIENDGDTDIWAWEIGANDLTLYFNGVQKGIYNDVDGVYSPSSDRRLKEQINSIGDGVLENFMKLEPSSYYFKDDVEKKRKSYGLIAQDVQKLFPEVVLENDNSDADLLAIKYNDLNVIAIKAIQEQQMLIKELTAQVSTLQKSLAENKQ